MKSRIIEYVNRHGQTETVRTTGTLLGVGGFGTVYLADVIEGPRRGEKRAVKFSESDVAGHDRIITPGPEELSRKSMFREKGKSGLLIPRHDNVVTVHGFGEEPIPFHSMEFIEGASLHEFLSCRADRYDPREILGVVYQTVLGLGAIHYAGVFHGDLKPGNVSVSEERVSLDGREYPHARILDIGVSFDFYNSCDSRYYTPDYAAPEQFRKRGCVEARSDLYSLAVTLYASLTGRLPRGDEVYPGISRKVRPMNQDLMDLLVSAMHPDVSKRPGLPEFSAELRRMLQTSGLVAQETIEPTSASFGPLLPPLR